MQKSTRMGMKQAQDSGSQSNSADVIKEAERHSPLAANGTPALTGLAGTGSQDISEYSSGQSIPLPGMMKGALQFADNHAGGHDTGVFLNKLGERMAYEGTGVRLYESFIRKCEMHDAAMAPLPMKEVLDIRNDEEEHFFMLQECMRMLGADPDAQTPDADISGVAISGLMKVIDDPCTSISQSLEALLTIELTDNAAWELLITLSSDMGLHDMTERFRKAQTQELLHLERVRTWYETAITAPISKRQGVAH